MKKAAYVLAVIGIINIMAGIAFKMHHLDGASFLGIWGTMFNELVVLPVIAIYMMRNKYSAAYTFGILSLFLLIAGIFFKIQHWPASFAITMLGLVLFSVSAIFCAKNIYKYDNGK